MPANRLTRREMLGLLAGLGVPEAVFSQDPVAIEPKSYRVVFENNRVRVLEYNNRPGLGPCGRGLHYHPAHLNIIMSGFAARTTRADGKIVTGSAKAGDVTWHEAGTHEVETVDKAASRLLMIEMKDASWNPSTG